MNPQLRTVIVRIAQDANGGIRAWSDDLPDLNMTCPNHQVLFAELSLREIHQFIVEIQPS